MNKCKKVWLALLMLCSSCALHPFSVQDIKQKATEIYRKYDQEIKAAGITTLIVGPIVGLVTWKLGFKAGVKDQFEKRLQNGALLKIVKGPGTQKGVTGPDYMVMQHFNGSDHLIGSIFKKKKS